MPPDISGPKLQFMHEKERCNQMMSSGRIIQTIRYIN